MRAIEIAFAVDVEMTDEQHKRLHELVSEIVAANTPEGYVHWISSGGYKPLWSDADAAIFNFPGGRSGKPKGEPDFDEDTFMLSTSIKKVDA